MSFSQNITHFGFSLFLLSIIFNNLFTSEVITNLKVGDTFGYIGQLACYAKASNKKVCGWWVVNKAN